jgi:hypothetical protein
MKVATEDDEVDLLQLYEYYIHITGLALAGAKCAIYDSFLLKWRYKFDVALK